MLKITATAPTVEKLRETLERAAKFLMEGHDLAYAVVRLPGEAEFKLDGEPERLAAKARKPRKPSTVAVKDWSAFWTGVAGAYVDVATLTKSTGCTEEAAKQAIRLAVKRGVAVLDDGRVRVLKSEPARGQLKLDESAS